MSKKLYCDYEKEFISPTGLITATRGEFTSSVCPMIAEELDDTKMQKIVDDTENELLSTYTNEEIELLRKYKNSQTDLTTELTQSEMRFAEHISSTEFEFFEKSARNNGMRYWEDLDEKEYKELCAEIKKAQNAK